MGFAELFASPLGDAARAKTALGRGLSRWLEATLVTVRAAGPVVQNMAYSALWAEVDSTKELAPLAPQGLLQVLRAELAVCRVRPQKCTGQTTSRFCACGGISGSPEVVWEKEEIPFPDCPKGRRFCTSAVECKRHGGLGYTIGDVETFVEAPKCPHCAGTGIIPRDAYMERIRAEYDHQKKTYARPSNPLHEWILEEGATRRFDTRCQNWQWTSKSQCGKMDENPCDSSTWMAAAQILFDNSDAQVCYPGTVYTRLKGGSSGYDDWCRLPPNREMCNRLFDWWHRKYTPGYQTPSDTLSDFVKPRMGECNLPIEKDIHLLPREWLGKVSMGDFTHFEWCLDGLRSSMEEFLDIFYDCAAQFDGSIGLSLNEHGRPSRVCGTLGGVQVLFTAPVVCSPMKLLPEIGENNSDNLESGEFESHIPPLFRENGLSALYRNLVLQQTVPTTILRAHPDQDEVEDQLDHLENKQGGEIVTTPSFIKMLKGKRKEVRGKEFQGGSEGRLTRSADLELSKKDIFLAHSLMDRFQNMSVVRKYAKSDPKLTKVCVDLTNQEEVIKFPPKELMTTTDGVLSAQTFTVLNRPQFNGLNKLAEAGWKEAKSVCLNLHIRSYLPVHLPVYAFCVIMWGHSSNASQASLSGAYVYLGDQEASVLQLPLLCGYIGNSLGDMEAYKRSLVLSTCFYGTSGLSPGQNMFGITAVEFTEYLPTSYGGITHERDSWNQMLRNHQAVDKQRFISGFNVVDFVEAGKEKQLKFPEFELQPVPKNQPPVRTFDDTVQPPLNKTCSMRVKTFSAFRAGNIPIGGRVDNTKSAIQYELGRASTSGANPRLDDSICNLRASGDYAFGHTLELPATVAVGTVIGSFNIFDSIQAAGTRVCNEWLQEGYVSQNLTMISHLAPNAYSGVALWYIFDAYGKIPSDITTTMEEEIARSFAPHLHNLREPKTASWLVDFHKMCGQTLNFSGSGYCTPKIWVVAASSVQLARSTAAKFRVEFYTCGERLVKGLAENPLVYPVDSKHLSDLGLVLQSRQLALGTYNMVKFPIALARKQETATKRVVYSYAAGLLSHFLGIGGTIHFTVDIISSVFVTCNLRVAIWGSTPTTDQLAQMPHVDVLSGEVASLRIQSPFFATANFGDSGASFYVSTLCAPMAPETMETTFEYSVRILGVETAAQLCREINYKQKFAWFMLKSDNAQIPLSLRIPSRLVNVVSTKITVTNYVNAFAIMCATAGMHHGNCILHFSWEWHHSEAGKQSGRLAIATGMGGNGTQEHIGDISICNYPQSSFQLPFQFGSFAGPVPSGGTPHGSENWFELRSPNVSWIDTIYVGVEVLDGFKFYGRSAGPLTIPTSKNKDVTVPASTS